MNDNKLTFSQNLKFFENFERPFTLRGWLRSASNFVKTRFRRFPTFHFLTHFFRDFERQFTPPGWLRSASNFVKTRFRRSPTFHFSTAKTWMRIMISKNLKYVSLEAGCVAHDPHFTAFYRFFGRTESTTDLRISVSRAKFDAESDFEVR